MEVSTESCLTHNEIIFNIDAQKNYKFIYRPDSQIKIEVAEMVIKNS